MYKRQGLDLDNDEIAVVAIDGSTGNEIWTFEQSGTEVSSPAVYEDGSSRKVFVSVYDNNNLEVYAIQGGSGVSSWNPKTIGSIVNPNDVNLHPMLPSIAIADITDEDDNINNVKDNKVIDNFVLFSNFDISNKSFNETPRSFITEVGAFKSKDILERYKRLSLIHI